MTRFFASVPVVLSALLAACGSNAEPGPAALEGPYLGQTPPGLTPEPFAPGLVQTDEWEGGVAFSLDMNEFYFSRLVSDSEEPEVETLIYENVDGRWSKSDTYSGRIPFFAPDGETMHFGKRYKERTDTGWSEKKDLGGAYDDIRVMTLKVSNYGTYVFDEIGTDGDGILRYSRLIAGERQAPTPFGAEINTGTWNAHPYIAPDESYIMWDGERAGGNGDSDIYVSFKEADGSWGDAINLGDAVNTEVDEGGPLVTPDGKYLFFNRVVAPAVGDGWPDVDTYWVDAQIIENLRPEQ